MNKSPPSRPPEHNDNFPNADAAILFLGALLLVLAFTFLAGCAERQWVAEAPAFQARSVRV